MKSVSANVIVSPDNNIVSVTTVRTSCVDPKSTSYAKSYQLITQANDIAILCRNA